ncbi:DUF624 domain-containing protein [Tamlana haliotis]|uniref:DUF624 domain-containing protein n=1 Tax=Pseudotamlana haliotis TaxID=2614804 RepID=A0A6N6MG25_9FLAO|nr:DUF624 domain-containing protein [Tamlana haliotis]KAB1068782.1 DUF624 domain-containing protein [Tamlana haliotis]
MNTITTFLEKLEQIKALDFGDIFNKSIELFKKTWLQGFLLLVITIAIMLPIIIVLYVPLIGLVVAQGENADPAAFTNFFAGMSVLYVVFVIVGVLVLGSVAFAINAAFYRIMKKMDDNQEVTIKDFFYFLKKKYLGKTTLLMLFSVFAAMLSVILFYVPLLYMIVPLSFIAAVFAFNPHFSVSDIIKASFKLANKKWMLAFGLIIVSQLLSQIVGGLACGVGLLFTSAFVYHPVYILYKKMIGFNEKDAIEEIGTSVD